MSPEEIGAVSAGVTSVIGALALYFKGKTNNKAEEAQLEAALESRSEIIELLNVQMEMIREHTAKIDKLQTQLEQKIILHAKHTAAIEILKYKVNECESDSDELHKEIKQIKEKLGD